MTVDAYHSPAWWALLYQQDFLCWAHQPGLVFASAAELGLPRDPDPMVLGQYQGSPCFSATIARPEELAVTLTPMSQRTCMMSAPPDQFYPLSRASQLTLFMHTHRFCGQCGSATQLAQDELAMHCHQCQLRCYPRISPVVIVAILAADKILLAQGERHKGDRYSVLAGFVESGETLEQAVHREVMEEVGIRIKNLEYQSSQPWPFPHSLMIGYLAEYDSGDICVDNDEIITADWFSFDALPPTPPSRSIAGQLIARAKARIKG